MDKLEQYEEEKASSFSSSSSSVLQMLVKQKEANRQSMLLLQSAEPSIQLLKALEDVAAVTKTLEEERLQHQQKVKHESIRKVVTRQVFIQFD